MTTAGERLVQLSGLSSGSAVAHLSAISAGSGSGSARITSSVRVIASQRQVSVIRKSRVLAEGSIRQTAPTSRKEKRCGGKEEKGCCIAEIFASFRREKLFVAHQPADSVIAMQRYSQSVISYNQNRVTARKSNK